MAASKLGLYQDALQIIGQRQLTGLTEDREPRHILDNAYDNDAIAYCLEIVKPVFSRITTKLSSPSTSAQHALDSVHTLPSDYLDIVKVYSDDKLDQEIERYIIEGNTLACEYGTIYLRYVSDTHITSFTNWTSTFSHIVSAYLAREISKKLAPTQYEESNTLFLDRVESLTALDREREPSQRPSATTNTLTNEWRLIYNDALLIMGLDEINDNSGDSNRRTKLDRALDAGIVSEMLETTGWTFAVTSTKSQFDPSIEPSWGYKRAHAKPSAMHRLDGMFYDEFMQQPLKLYHDEGNFFFTDEDEFIVAYISTDFLVNPAQWPTHFKRLIAGRMANDAAPSLKNEGADPEKAKEVYEERESSSKSIDAMAAPPRKLAVGKWSTRFKGNYRGRP